MTVFFLQQCAVGVVGFVLTPRISIYSYCIYFLISILSKYTYSYSTPAFAEKRRRNGRKRLDISRQCEAVHSSGAHELVSIV
jgi:hypothetical protein